MVTRVPHRNRCSLSTFPYSPQRDYWDVVAHWQQQHPPEYRASAMSSYMLGMMLKDNLMDGRPSRMKNYSDYTGLVIPPCGEFAPKSSSISPPPWMPAQANVGFAQRLSLHREIEHFVAYMKPTKEEKALRKDVVARFTKLIKRLAPNATVRAVGSSVTGLDFPTSDIDMVIAFPEQSLRSGATFLLSQLEYKIRASGFSSRIESVLHASIPLLRITDAVTGIEIDLTGEVRHGVDATAAVVSWMAMKEGSEAGLIQSLVMVLKMFLSIRRLGTTFTGGVNSYLLVWMVVAWVKLEYSRPNRRGEDLDDMMAGMGALSMGASGSRSTAGESAHTGSRPSHDLGAALLGFLRFYGQEFDYASKAIRFTSTSVRYSTKPPSYSIYSGYRDRKQYLLSITDPASLSIDMGQKAYGVKHVRETFRDAYANLSALTEGTATRDELVRARFEGALGSFLGGDHSNFINKRKGILRKWKSSTQSTV